MEQNILDIIEQEKQLMVGETEDQPVGDVQVHTAEEVVYAREQDVLDRISQKTKFQERSENVITKAVNAELDRREIVVLDQEQKNELARLQLRLNKKTMRDEAKAKHYERKRKAKMVRYGYLYTPYEVEIINPDTGELEKETRYKNFTTNGFINRYKEFANFYANLAKETQKIIKTTLKIGFWIAVAAIIILIGYFLLRWLLNNPLIQQIVQNNGTESIAKIVALL